MFSQIRIRFEDCAAAIALDRKKMSPVEMFPVLSVNQCRLITSDAHLRRATVVKPGSRHDVKVRWRPGFRL